MNSEAAAVIAVLVALAMGVQWHALRIDPRSRKSGEGLEKLYEVNRDIIHAARDGDIDRVKELEQSLDVLNEKYFFDEAGYYVPR